MLLVNARAGQSAIHGLGLIAKEFVPAGTVVWQFTPTFDVEIPEADLMLLSPTAQAQVRHYAEFLPGRRAFRLSSDDDRFCNHSDTPNLIAHGVDAMVAARDISPGEEVTCDYRHFIMVNFRPGGQS